MARREHEAPPASATGETAPAAETADTSRRVPVHALLIDGLNLIRRVYAAQPGPDGDERAQGAVVASRQSLRRALREASPTHAVVVFEDGGSTWRHESFPGYKANHKPMPEALRRTLADHREAFAELRVRSLDIPGAEADDVIATLAAKIAAAGGRCTILSTDKAFLQLLGPRVRIRDHFAKRDLGIDAVRERFGVRPAQLVDCMALAGDSTNSIPGVPGIGLKTAAALLRDFGSLDWALAAAGGQTDLDEGLPELRPRLAQKLVDHAQDALLARSLVELRTDLELGVKLSDLRLRQPAPDES